MKTYIKLLFVMAALLTLTNCDKKENKNTTYRWDGINCLSNDNGQVVAANLCGQVGSYNAEYTLDSMGRCVSRYTGQIAPSNLYCSNTERCIGTYLYQYNQQQYTVTSNDGLACVIQGYSNQAYPCAGAQMVNISTGRSVTCM